MQNVTNRLKPERLWWYFEELSRIPRCSKNSRRVVRFIEDFARERNLWFKKDSASNIVLVRPATRAMAHMPRVVLQSHVDMVCEKNRDSRHDFMKDPISLRIDGEWVKAKNTTLGADNGIGVAAMLAVLEDKTLNTGPLECLFTTDEEIGLIGAFELDPSMIEGKMLINLDTGDLGVIYVGCAGGKDSHMKLSLDRKDPLSSMWFGELRIGGLKGGHSGAEIHLGGANALKCMGRALFHIGKQFSFSLFSLTGGARLNAIPREACAKLAVEKTNAAEARGAFLEYCENLKNEYRHVDPGFSCDVLDCSAPVKIFDKASTEALVNLLMIIPHGVLSMSNSIEGLVETSTNLASVSHENELVSLHMSHRSSNDGALDWISDVHSAIAKTFRAEILQNNRYAPWTPHPDSTLAQCAVRAIRKVTGTEPKVTAVHAGLECGVLKEKCGGMDAISIGPTMKGLHSPDEMVHIPGVETFWNILLETLNAVYAQG
jgi:dipeptidase D